MKPKIIKTLRKSLGLSGLQFGRLLGFGVAGAGMRTSELETGRAPISGHVARIVELLEAMPPRALKKFINGVANSHLSPRSDDANG